MFVLRVTYLTGRVYSAVLEEGDAKATPEWPPHPSRLFSALVAAWGEGGGEAELDRALQWLEAQPAPVIYAGDCSPRKLVQAFVPVNDVRSLPDDRPRKPRTFPSASLSRPDVYFVWRTEPPTEIASALDRVLRRTCSVGHPASLVAVEIASAPPEGEWNIWEPDGLRGPRMRIAYRGRFQELSERYRRFEQDPRKIYRPSAGRTTIYSRAAAPKTAAIQSIFGEMIVLKRDAGPKASLRSTLGISAALRGAIQKLAADPVPEYLTGHAPESTPENPVRSERPHVALVPLAFVDAPYATGEILGMGVLLPRVLNRGERQVCWDAIGSIRELRMAWGKWTVSLADAEESRRTLLAETWTRSHTVWSTVTPFVFDRYPKDPYGREAEEVVRQAFVRVGLPEPCELDLHYNAWLTGVPRASLFSPAPSRPGKPQRNHCHVRARFDQAISGPVLAGAGRYYGYGFFAPLSERRDRQ